MHQKFILRFKWQNTTPIEWSYLQIDVKYGNGADTSPQVSHI